MRSVTVTAPAKVNLYLKILGKRKDGYHDILTIFQRIGLCDRITISKKSSGIALSSDKHITRNPKDNLMYKAAKLILDRSGCRGGVSIRISKKIPIAAGLGGGSSDAAAVLVGMNRLYRLGFTKKELAGMGKSLGSDIPFFVLDLSSAMGRGRGTELSQLRPKIRPYVLLVNPGFGASTKEIYQYYDKYTLLTRKPGDAKITPSIDDNRTLGDLEHMLYNDLEETSVARNAGIRNVLERLAVSLGKKAIVSGSGPSVFCLYGTKKEASEARKKLLGALPEDIGKIWQVFAVRAV